jgi:hypothetical protein
MTEAICPKCGTTERWRSPSGLQAYCKSCLRSAVKDRKRRLRLGSPPEVVVAKVPYGRGYRAPSGKVKQIAAVVRHVVTRLSFAEAWVECLCGFRAEGKAQALAEAFNEHRRAIRLDL